MKKSTFSRIVFIALLLLMGLETYAQDFVPFTPRFNETLKGDIRLIGNNILSEHATNPYNKNVVNNDRVNMIYVDIDGDGDTFNSSSADLEIPNDGCYKIVHAGLYWGAVNRGVEPLTDVKFKGPEGGYTDIKGTVIYDAKTNVTGSSLPYASYADVTSIVAGFGTNLGTYTVANVSTGQGKTYDYKPRNGTGHSAGWSLFIVFEDPTLPGKYITSFDGFSSINKDVAALDIPISGFQTPPAPIPVTAKFAFAALEGDKGIVGDNLKINGTTMFTVDRPINNFFNSTVTKLGGGLVTNRNPNSTNTLGFDTGIMDVPNPNKTVIGNGDTSAIIRMESSQDQYFTYFIAFAVDVIQPKIVLTKTVTDSANVDIGGTVVQLGQELNYIIGFQNKGNDDAQNMVIRDVLPINIIFDYPSGLTLPSSVSSHSYDPLTRELIFNIKNEYIGKDPSPLSEIKIQVKVVESCNELNDMCSNKIENQAFTTYYGVENPGFESTDDPSVNTNTGCLLIPQATNFLADLNDCVFTEYETLCKDSVTLTAGDGYNSYLWSSNPDGTGILGTSQSITVSAAGTYYVHNTANAPCQSIDQIFEVTNFVGATLINPVTPFADIISECTDDGGKLPKIFLCGGDDSRLIDTKITDASSIIWQKLVEGSCPTSGSDNCANQGDTCTWENVSTGPTFNANQAGQFRLTLNYDGGCHSQYYFNVYQNMLKPNIEKTDIICNIPGTITVGGVPAGYEYSLDKLDNYQVSNVFSIATPGFYTVYVKQVNVDVDSKPCIFTTSIQIDKTDLEVETQVNQPKCYGDKGNIYVEAKYVRKQYKFTLSQNGVLVNTPGLQDDNFHTFQDLNPGMYTILVNTDDGCTYTEDIEIIAPLELTANSDLTIPLTCENGEITITAQGGTPPYYYFVNAETTLFEEFVENQAKYEVTGPGVYKFRVVDSNDCETTTEINVGALPAPVYTVDHGNVLCYNSNTGEIRFDVTNANGYTITYSINDGVDYETNGTFSNLDAGSYITNIKYSIAGVECFSDTKTIDIIQADTALTASAGVSQLAGCGPSGEGLVRITNPQGGTPPYQHSFDNQSSWIPSNEAYITPGTYTLYIKDANGCIFPMPGIILDPEPVAPTIDVSDPNFNCDGTADATVTVTNPETASFTYTYLLNGVVNTNTADPKTFLNVPNGDHIITVRYNLESVSTYSNLLYETFGYGEDTTSPGINTDYYCFERQVEATKCNGNIAINDGDYSVTARVVSPFSTWLQPGDHTPNPNNTPKGRSLVVNIGDKIPVTAVLYQKEINDIIPNQPINVEFFAMNLIKSSSNIYDPNLLVALVDASGNEISSFSTGDIPKSEQWENYPKTPMTLNPGANTSLKFIVRSNVRQVNGNDVAIDDIKVYQLPKICITEVNFPFIVATDKAFTAKVSNFTNATCFGNDDGSITISAQNFNLAKGFQYSLDGVTWLTEMTSPTTITGLAAGNYNVQVRYDNTDDTCSVLLSQEIKAPSVLELTAIGTPATCLTGGTIKATATGGSTTYSYELLDTASLTLIKNFPSNGVLSDVSAGDYTVRATDVNGCTVTTTVSIVSSDAPTATMDVSTYCFGNVNGVTLDVTAADGKAPYNYSINGQPFSSKYKFTGLTPGTYTVVVRDANGCTVTLDAVTIEPQLALTTEITKNLDCTASANATLKGTFSGGYAPYTYEVSINGGTYADLGAAGTPFIYDAENAGTYQFRITDAKGCTAISDISTIDPIVNPSATTTIVNATCNGDSNGSFQIIPSGGVGPYTYSVDGSAFTSTSKYTGLAAGTYTYQVKDAKNCLFEGSVTITEASALVASAEATTFSCSVDNSAQAAMVTIATPTTGTAPYKYSFNGSAYTSTNSLSVNDNGSNQTITYSVKDANGCTDGGSLIVSPLDPPTDLIFSTTAVTCLDSESEVTITAKNGVGVLTYEIISPATAIGNTTGATSGVFTGLTPDTYVFMVTDENGCSYAESLPIAPVTNIAVTGMKLSDGLCYGDAVGAVQFTVSGYSSGYDAVLTSGTGTLTQTADKINLTDLVAGSYTIEVTDTATGCTATDTIVISQPDNALALTATATNVHCNNYESQITATATGGTLNYTYVAVTSGSPAPNTTDYKSGSIITVDTNSGIDLNWDVYVKDANGCAVTTSVTIVAESLPTVTVPSVSNQCTVSSGFTFTAVGTGVAPLQYSINGGAYQDSGTFTVNAAGSYTVTIKDANGCIATSTTATQVFEPITVSASLTQDLSCFPDPNGLITITASGGNAPYTYEVSIDGAPYTSITGSPYTATAAGDYQFRVTDANGCDKETAIVTVNPAIQPEITALVVAQEINCSGDETGALTITYDTSKGMAPFVINVTKTSTTVRDYGTQTSGLAAGEYLITVTDAKGCTDTKTITIAEPEPILVNYHAEPITCDISGGESKGSVIVDSVSGGTPPYNYFVTGTNGYNESELNADGSTSIKFNVVDFGLYQINVVDSNGCSMLLQDVLVASPPTDLDIDIAPTADCVNGGQAVVSIGTTLSGAGPFFFSIYEGPTSVYPNPAGSWQAEDAVGSKTTIFTGLTPGVLYTFIVYDDSTGCSYYETAPGPIPTNSTLTTDEFASSNITCKGSADGSVSFTINSIYGADINVSFEIFNSLSLSSTTIIGTGTVPANGSLPVTNLGPLDFGNYYVLIEEITGPNAGCGVVTIPFNITESSIDLSITAKVSKNENCNELGVISATGSFGTAPYQYQVVATGAMPVASDYDTPNTFLLAAGTYDVYVRDVYGCEKFDTVTLIKDPEPTIDPVAEQCFDGTAFDITLSGTTFNATATYSIGGAFQSNPVFTITAAGSYTVSIKDANGCIATDTFIVAPPLLLDAILDLDLTCTVDGSITLTANGGTGTYNTYEVSSDGGLTYTAVGGTTFTTDTDGTYIFRVTDTQGCIAVSNEIIVTPNTTPTLTHIQTDVSCNGGADGTIIVTAANGIAPYRYSINGGSFQTSNVFENLSAGLYTIVVQDGKNCDSAAITVEITEPDPVAGVIVLTQGLTCGVGNATQAATITITGSDGTSPYTYSFDGINFTSVNTYKTFVAGTVTGYVRDANGCSISAPISIDVPALSVPTDLDFVATDVTCIATESVVTLTTTGGVGTLTYEIITPASATGNISGATSGVFTGLLPGTYSFTVTDENGCYYTEAYTVIPVTNIIVSGSLVKDVSCFGDSDGAVTFEVGRFAGTYSYQINGGITVSGQTNTTIPLTNLPAGDQTIVVTDDTTGCTATYAVTVSQPTPVALVEIDNINAYCDFGSVVTVEASGGTAPYQYAFVVDGSAPNAADYTNSNTAVLDATINTNWDVWVMDSNGCDTKIDVVIATDPLPTIETPTLAANQCTVANGFEFTVTNPTGIAPFTYSIGNGFQSSPTFTVSTAGTYTVTIKDAHGCTNAVPVSIEIYPALVLTPTITGLTTCANDDGEITVTAEGGSGTYIYSINSSVASISLTGNVFSGVPSGSYVITIEDTVTGCKETAPITLDAATVVDFTLTPTEVSCNGGSDGTITVDLTVGNDDNPIYTYEIIAGPITKPVQNSNLFTGLEAGTYTVQVNSGRGCVDIKDVKVREPDVIVVAAPIVVEYACTTGSNATTFASISVNTVTGGSGTYTRYEFIRGATVVQSGTQNVYTETNLAGGSYTINVYDNNGCLGTTTAIIQPFISIDALSVAIDTAITCTNDESITVSVTSTGGIPTNLEFTLMEVALVIPNQVNSTGVFTGLPVGNYKITVINLDTGCTLQTVHYVNEPNTFDLSVDTVIDVTCFSGNDGSVNVTFINRVPTPTNEAGPFSYTVVNALGVTVDSGTTLSAGPITISSLVSGTYTITASLTNSPFCTVDKNFTITAPSAALAVFETHTEITCVSGNNDGSIFATATGGWPGAYEFELSGTAITTIPYSPNGYFKNLSAGVYTVSVRDSKGCPVSKVIELTNPLPITFTASADVAMLSCYGDKNATITVDLPIGGQGSNYSYTLNTISPVASSSGPQSSPIFSGLGAGTYSITVTDGYNCTETSATIVIAQPAEIKASLVTATTATCLTDASLTLSATGGTGSYEYSISSTFAIILGSFATSTTIANVPVGTHRYYVRDTNGCVATVSNDIKIEPVPLLVLNLDVINATINCAGDNTGVIVAKAQGGLGNYAYTLQDALGNPIPAVQTTPGVFTELFAGTYFVRVDSEDCTETSGAIVITEPDAALDVQYDVFDVSCNGAKDGSIEINTTGGTGDITYAISPQLNQFFTKNIFEDLAPGDYTIIVNDANGCYEVIEFEIVEPSAVAISIVPNSILPEICEGGNEGEFSITVSGGTAPYSVSVDDFDGPYTTGTLTQSQFDFTGLMGGDHTVFVRDSVGCESEWNITFPESVKIDPVAEVEYLCDNNTPGNSVTVTVDSSNSDLSELDFSLNGGTYQSSNVFNNVVAGIGHYIDVRHSNGCIQRTDLFSIDQVDPLMLGLNDGGLNEIVAMATGGTTPYQFTLNGQDYGNTSSFIITKSGDYTVTVTDSSGCVATTTRYFEFIDICIPNYFTPNGDGNLDTWAPGCAINYPNMEFKIFDRYGREVGAYRQGQAWDGKYKERELPTGDYWYIVKLNNGKDDRDFVGHFTLYR